MSAWWAIIPCLIFLVVGLVVGAEFGGKPRSGVHVIRGEMDPNYEPPSTSLWPSPPPLASGVHQRDCPECTSAQRSAEGAHINEEQT